MKKWFVNILFLKEHTHNLNKSYPYYFASPLKDILSVRLRKPLFFMIKTIKTPPNYLEVKETTKKKQTTTTKKLNVIGKLSETKEKRNMF